MIDWYHSSKWIRSLSPWQTDITVLKWVRCFPQNRLITQFKRIRSISTWHMTVQVSLYFNCCQMTIFPWQTDITVEVSLFYFTMIYWPVSMLYYITPKCPIIYLTALICVYDITKAMFSTFPFTKVCWVFQKSSSSLDQSYSCHSQTRNIYIFNHFQRHTSNLRDNTYIISQLW